MSSNSTEGGQGNNPGNNPKWKTFLDVIPEELHFRVIPVLKDWDKGVQERFEEIRSEYKGYDDYKEVIQSGIPVANISQALTLADMVQDQPGEIVKRINEAYELGYVSPEEAQRQAPVGSDPSGDDLDYDLDGDISKHPVVAQLAQQLEAMQNRLKEQDEQDSNQQEIAEFQQYLDELDKNTEGGIDKAIVTAYMQQGFDGDDAVKAYQDLLAKHLNPGTQESQAQNPPVNDGQGQEQPPVVMGGNGGAGSGTEQQTTDFGSMKSNDVVDLVTQYLQNAATASGQG